MLQRNEPEKARIKVLGTPNCTDDKMCNVFFQLGAAGGYVGHSPNIGNVVRYQVNGTDQRNETVPWHYWKEA